jgi:hypothetical protein
MAQRNVHPTIGPRRLLAAGATYFALVFVTGFVLGAIRTLLIVPRVGERTAELLETPLMIGWSWVVARWVVRRYAIPARTSRRLAMGAIAFALLLGLEFTVVLAMRNLTVDAYLASRDPVSGVAYALALIVFALLPALVERH